MDAFTKTTGGYMSSPAVNATNRTSIEISNNRCCFPCCPRKKHHKSRRESQVDATIKVAEALRQSIGKPPADAAPSPREAIDAAVQAERERNAAIIRNSMATMPIHSSQACIHTPDGFRPGAWPPNAKWVPMPPRGSTPPQTGC